MLDDNDLIFGKGVVITPGDAVQFKYNEPKILQDIEQYIGNTYSRHYVGDDNVQLMDLIFSNGEAMVASKFNVLKYVNRFGKKEGENIEDLYKAAHYLIFMIHELERRKK